MTEAPTLVERLLDWMGNSEPEDRAFLAEVETLTRERDEAQAANAVCRRDIEALMSSCDTLERERDEARAEAEQAHHDFCSMRDLHDRFGAEMVAQRDTAIAGLAAVAAERDALREQLAAEREACAKIADDRSKVEAASALQFWRKGEQEWRHRHGEDVADDIAALIRAREVAG